MINFKVNQNKLRHAIVYLASKAPERPVKDLFKLLYQADTEHLNTYGRPITGDKYIVEKNTVVPKTIKNGATVLILKSLNKDYFSTSDFIVLDHVLESNKSLEKVTIKISAKEGSEIAFEDMITNSQVLEELKMLGAFEIVI